MALFFDYDLPERLIAQHPTERRDHSRLMVLDRHAGSISHFRFAELPRLLQPGDLLVLNDTKVIPARLVGQRCQTGGRWEGLFLRELPDQLWEIMAKTRGYPQVGERFETEPTGLRLTLIDRTADRHWLVRPDRPGNAADILAVHGQVPLPPYIRKGQAAEADQERYQTVFAQRPGSVAAPTAGLHFTEELLAQLRQQQVGTARVTLHVGTGTFAPIQAEDPKDHPIHAEWCELGEDTAHAIAETRDRHGRVIAVGTTTTRTLETAAQSGSLEPFRGESRLYIHPPYQFRAIDGLITNFHLPRTTLLLMVQALAGAELLRQAYEEAVAKEYRFYSYGDAMLIL